MSRIGKKLIVLPDKTEVKVSGNVVVVKGPLGVLSRPLHPVIEIKIEVLGPSRLSFDGLFQFRPEVPLDGLDPST